MQCPICRHPSEFLRTIDAVAYFRCTACRSLFADPDFLAAVEAGTAAPYGDAYWAEELAAARDRCFGPGIVRVAETLRMARIPVRRFLDIGSGAGTLLDALALLAPSLTTLFHGIERFPPPPSCRSRHSNYCIGSIADLSGPFDAGVCIEVIEHLTPPILSAMLGELAARSSPGALYFFNSAQPSFVQTHDPAYLDPKGRGHIVSWSIEGARAVFAPAGFNVIALPGRDWAFLAEFGPQTDVTREDLFDRLWHPLPENMALLQQDPFGPLLLTTGLEFGRCFLERGGTGQATAQEPVRGLWRGRRRT